MKTKKVVTILIALVLVFSVSIGIARLADNQFGAVKVQTVEFSSSIDTSAKISGRLYIPSNATPTTPAPALLFCMGNDTDSHKNSAFSLEFSRRGYVVLSIDLRGQGFSTGDSRNLGRLKDVGIFCSQGATEATEYLRGLTFVDKDKIVAAGHSRGAGSVAFAIRNHPDWYAGMVDIGVAYSTLAPLFPAPDAEGPANLNVAFIYALDDAAFDKAATLGYMGVAEADFENGKIYGDLAQRSGRMYYQLNLIHNMEYINEECIGQVLSFLMKCAPAPNPIDPKNQTWSTRFIGTTIAYVALIGMVFAIGALLLKSKCFEDLVGETPEYKGNTGKKWWIFAVITAVISPLTFFHVCTWSDDLLSCKFWPVQRITCLMGWGLFCALIGIIIILVNHFIQKARNNENRPTAYSLGIVWKDKKTGIQIFKSFLLAFSIFLILYVLVTLTYHWTGIFPLMWNNEFKPLITERLGTFIRYLIPFTAVYFMIAVNLHGTLRPAGGKLSIVKEVLVNIAIMAPWYLVWVIWFGPFKYMQEHGEPAFAGRMYAFFWAMPAMMTIVASISTYFYRKTGKIWVGAFLNGLMITWAVTAGFCNVALPLG